METIRTKNELDSFDRDLKIDSLISIYKSKLTLAVYANLARRQTVRILERDEPGYTSHHDNDSDSCNHSTSRGDDHTTHNYRDNSDRYDPWPVGGNDKWISNDNNTSSNNNNCDYKDAVKNYSNWINYNNGNNDSC
jgi:hypothetical protein